MLVIGILVLVCALVAAFRHKVYVDKSGHFVQEEIDMPGWGKVRSNTPAVALGVVGAIIVLAAGGVEAFGIERNAPAMVPINGELIVDGRLPGNIPSLTVGLVSGGWVQSVSPNGERTISVNLAVPNSWTSYFAFVFSQNDGRVRPKLIGAQLNSKFQLKVEP